MSDAMRITVMNQNLTAVTGTEAKPVLVETVLQQEAGMLKTFLSLYKGGTPVLFNQVFESFQLTAQSGDAPDDGPYEMTGSYAAFQFGPPDGYSQPVGFSAVTEVRSIVSQDAEEGDYTVHVEVRDGDTVIGSADIAVKIVTVETALLQYEQLLTELSGAELEELETQYRTLESLRQVVNAAILSLPPDRQPSLMTRYYAAAGSQYASFKLLTLYRARENRLYAARVKNVGGNAPYSIVFKDRVCVGDASEAYLFYPEGYRAAQTGVPNYPADQPDSMQAALVPGQTNLVVGNHCVKGGRFVAAYKVGDAWFYATYEMNDAGTEIVAVNDTAVSVTNAGDEYVAPLELAMQNAAAKTALSMTVSPAVADKSEDVTAAITVSYPVFEAAIGADMLLDFLVECGKSLPIGATVQLKNADALVGTYDVTKDGVKAFFVSEAFGITRTVLGAHSGSEAWSMVLSHGAPGECDLTVRAVAAKADSFEVVSSRYMLASHTETMKIVDRRAALDAVIAGTKMTFAGDVIGDVSETIKFSVTTAYPAFLPDLDPTLAVDTLLTMNSAMPEGAVLKVFADELLLGTYTELTGKTQSLWLSDVIGTANVRPNLSDRDGGSVVYRYVLTGLADNEYQLSLKTIAAQQPNFESVDARYVLASVEVPITVTDKSNLVARIAEAEGLLTRHQPGEEPGCAATVPRMALQKAIDDAVLVRDEVDASRNEILNAITALADAITEFKTFIVKWRVDKAGLQISVDTADDLLATTTPGTGVGQASAEAIRDYQGAYDAAYTVLSDTPDFVDYFDTDTFHGYQAQIDLAKADLEAATRIFQDAVISDEDYAMEKIIAYEAAAKAFYDSIRKKIRI